MSQSPKKKSAKRGGTPPAPVKRRPEPDRGLRQAERFARIVVDLPAPLGPTNPVTCPGSTLNDIPSSAAVGPNRFRSPLTSTVVFMTRLYGSGANTARTEAVTSLLGTGGHPG